MKIEQLICNLVIDRLFFPVLKSEINCASDGSVETTKTSLACFPAVDQLVSWISRTNSVPLGILLSCIPRTFRQHGPTGSSKYGTTKNTHLYYTTKRLIRYI